ncbi:MAG: O-antigen ligase family protein [bacterium]|nr:O-antigen ligase family protein [bacterium]
MIFGAYFLIILLLVLLLYDYRSGIITCLIAVTNCGEFVYLNPNLEIGDFGGVGTIFFMDLFWVALGIIIMLKRHKLYLLNFKLSLLVLAVLFIISTVIPLLINSFSIKDYISVIRPLGNFLFLPYLVITITDMKALNFLEKSITFMLFFFIIVQVYEYVMQSRIPIRLLERYSMFFGEDPFAVEFGGIKTGYIWSRVGALLPFNLFFGFYYYFTDKRNYGLLLLGIYILSIMITLSRIWVIGFAFVLIVMTMFLISRKDHSIKVKLFALIGSFFLLGVILLYASTTFNQIFDIFLLRINSINDLADKTDSSFLGREYILLQMISVWYEYPFLGAGFSSISRRLVTNDLGFPNVVTIFGSAGIMMMTIFLIQFYKNLKPLIESNYVLFASLFSIMMMLYFMSIFSIDMFYFNATGALLFAFGNIILNVAKQSSDEDAGYNYAA